MLRTLLLLLCAALLAPTGYSADQPPAKIPSTPEITEQTPESTLKKSKWTRLEKARSVYEMKWKKFSSGKIPSTESQSDLGLWSERVRDAGLALTEKPLEKLAVLEDHLRRTYEMWKVVKANVTVGTIPKEDEDVAHYFFEDALVSVQEMRIFLDKLGIKPPKEIPETPVPAKKEPPPNKESTIKP